jgi:hypothetical protein
MKYRAPRNVVATFTQSVTRWHFRKANLFNLATFNFLIFSKEYVKEVFRTIFTPVLCTKICRDVARRVQLCIEHNGGQFEHFQ